MSLPPDRFRLRIGRHGERARRSLPGALFLPMLLLATSCTTHGAFLGPIQDVVVEERGSTGSDSQGCSSFALTPAQVEALLERVVVVTQRQIHDNFEVGSCFVKGRARLGHSGVTWQLQMGGTGRVVFVDAGEIFLVADPGQASPLDANE